MKSKVINSIITVFFLFAVSVNVNAEPTKELSEIDDVTKNLSSVNIKWEVVPEFHAEETIIVDSEGKPVLNEDGTQQIRVFLVDQYGNKRSAESVKSQITAINNAIGVILTKVGTGALIGALSGLKDNGTKKKLGGALVGGIVGSAAGALASTDDIKYAKAQKKSLKKQEKILAEYEKNFTAEGVPVNAKVDVSKLANLDLKPEAAKSATAEQIKQELANEEFNSSDTSAWNVE